MYILYHHPFSPASRFVRLILGEYGIEFMLMEERPWERRNEFLQINPEGTVPVLLENEGPSICGATVIMEYIDETLGAAASYKRLMPEAPEFRMEIRRLVNWFLYKFELEVGTHFVREKIYKMQMPRNSGGGEPDSATLRAARNNVKHHVHYLGYLASNRNWLAGSQLSFADFAAAAQLSIADYLGEVPWEIDEQVKSWYVRIKSRPSFRQLLNDRVPGLPPSKNYSNLDF